MNGGNLMDKDPFKEYMKQSEPNKRDKGYAWHTAIGLQAVDGLKPSKYLIDTAIKNIEGDISLISVDEFLKEIKKVAEESYRVLKKNKICAVMMGDIRKYGNVVPLGFRTMEKFLQAGFQSKEIIIKEQHNCMSTKYWKNRNNNFLLIAHEYIFVFQK